MKMKTNKFMTYALSAMMLGSLAACSSDDSEPDNGGNSGGETTDDTLWYGELKAQSRRVIICCSMRISLKTKRNSNRKW